MIMDEGLCNAEVIGGRGSLTCWLWLCEGLGPEHTGRGEEWLD